MHVRPFRWMLCFLIAAAPLWAAAPSGTSSWPQWRGPNRDGVSTETHLAKQWPGEGPAVLWQVEHVGVGYSSLAVVGGRIYTQGDIDGVEHVLAINVKDGSLVWRVQPQPVRKALDQRVAEEMKRSDRNGDGVLDEQEALARMGWNFNRYDKAGDGEAAQVAADRAAALLKQLDKNGDGRSSYQEAGSAFRDTFSNIDSAAQDADVDALAQQRAKEFIAAFDNDKDGQLSQRESSATPLRRRFRQIDERPEGEKKGDEQLTAAEIEKYLAKFEAGYDGLLTGEELSKYYARTFARQDGRLTPAELKAYFGGYRNGQGDGPRGTPLVEGDRVYVLGGNGDLTCLEAATGNTIWHVNLVADLGGGRPGWGYCESPLIVGDRLYVTPGGRQGTMAALEKATGKVVWRSDNTEGAQYSSAVMAEIAGKKQLVQFARNSMFGLDLATGKHLWSYSAANNGTANICTPIVEGDCVFASSAYGTGGGLAKITVTDSGEHKATQVYFEKKMANHHGGIVRVGEHLYGFGGGGLICMEMKSGKIAWTNRSVGKGSLVCADGMLFCLGERHQAALVEVNPKEYKEHGRFRIDNLGRPSWAHPVVCNGVLYIRNQGRLTAYEVAAKADSR